MFTLFIFVFMANMVGMFPDALRRTSHIIVTAAMACIVFLTVLLVGLAKNGFHFLKLFVPSGVPWSVLPLVALIEVISFLARPLSHSIRLWANIFAGHLMLKVVSRFVVMMIAAGGVWRADRRCP